MSEPQPSAAKPPLPPLFQPPTVPPTAELGNGPRPADPSNPSRSDKGRHQDSDDDFATVPATLGDEAPASTGSEPRGKASGGRIDAGLIKQGLREAILTGTEQAHRAFATDPLEIQHGLWRAEDKEADAVAAPLSKILARRAKAGGLTPDLVDAIQALIAAFGYLSRHLRLKADVRAARAEAGQLVDAATGDAAA